MRVRQRERERERETEVDENPSALTVTKRILAEDGPSGLYRGILLELLLLGPSQLVQARINALVSSLSLFTPSPSDTPFFSLFKRSGAIFTIISASMISLSLVSSVKTLYAASSAQRGGERGKGGTSLSTILHRLLLSPSLSLTGLTTGLLGVAVYRVSLLTILSLGDSSSENVQMLGAIAAGILSYPFDTARKRQLVAAFASSSSPSE